MKKICLLILICFCFVITGCSASCETGFIKSPSGSIIEFYQMPFEESKLLSAGVTGFEITRIKNNINNSIKEELNNYYQTFKTYVENDSSLTKKEKTFITYGVIIQSSMDQKKVEDIWFGDLNKVDCLEYQIYYINSTCYSYFKKANQLNEHQKNLTTKKFFTTTVKVTKDFNESVNLSKKIITICENEFARGLIPPNNWNLIKPQINFDSITSNVTYSYLSPTKRLHSNANIIEKIDEGYYKHTWVINTNNAELDQPIKIE